MRLRKLLFIGVMICLTGTLAWLLAAPAAACEPGTSLKASKSAVGFKETTIEYDWALQKSVVPGEIEIERGESGTVEYTITALRTPVLEVTRIGVRGQICVTNSGSRVTENLKIVDRVQYKKPGKGFKDLVGASQTIIPDTQLQPGETRCFDYEILFAPVPGATAYRNVARVTITNHSGHMGCAYGPEPKADFSLPVGAVLTEIDESADVTDVEICPDGFSCVPSDPGPWHFTGSGAVHFAKAITNVSAGECIISMLTNTATLIESDSGQERSASASVSISTPCEELNCETIALNLSADDPTPPVNKVVTLTVTLALKEGGWIAGYPVELWDVTEPQDPVPLGTKLTDDQGQATWDVSSDIVKTSVFEARVSFEGEPCDPARVSVMWTAGGQSIPGVTGWGVLGMIGLLAAVAVLMLKRRLPA